MGHWIWEGREEINGGQLIRDMYMRANRIKVCEEKRLVRCVLFRCDKCWKALAPGSRVRAYGGEVVKELAQGGLSLYTKNIYFLWFSPVFKGFWGFQYSLKMSFKLWKNDFHEWKKGNHENRGILWRKRGEKWRLVSSGGRGKMMILQQSFLMKSA